jgi:hypothetical protein
MSDLRFHISGARFRSFLARFLTLRRAGALRFRFVSKPFPTDTVRFQFPAYIRATGNEARSRPFPRRKIVVLLSFRHCLVGFLFEKTLPHTTGTWHTPATTGLWRPASLADSYAPVIQNSNATT